MDTCECSDVRLFEVWGLGELMSSSLLAANVAAIIVACKTRNDNNNNHVVKKQPLDLRCNEGADSVIAVSLCISSVRVFNGINLSFRILILAHIKIQSLLRGIPSQNLGINLKIKAQN